MPSDRATVHADNRQEHDHRTAKIIELVSSSPIGFEEAIQNALSDAAKTTRGITGCHVNNMSVLCDNGKIVAYKVDLKVSFGVEREGDKSQSQGQRGA